MPTVTEFERAREVERQTSDNASAMRTAPAGAAGTQFAELHASLTERRKQIEKLNRVLAAHQGELSKLRASAEKETANLSDLRSQRDRASLEFARDGSDQDRFDRVLEKLDREINRGSSRLFGLNSLIEVKGREIATSTASLTSLNHDEGVYQHHLEAQRERKELDVLVHRGEAAIEVQTKAAAELAEIMRSLRTRDYLSEANKAFGMLSVEKIGRLLAGYRE